MPCHEVGYHTCEDSGHEHAKKQSSEDDGEGRGAALRRREISCERHEDLRDDRHAADEECEHFEGGDRGGEREADRQCGREEREEKN